MSGSILQLLAYGAQDLFLTGNPSITHFKTTYRRHTNFSMQMIKVPFETNPTFTETSISKATVKIERHGDLLHDCYLVYDLPDIFTNEENNFKWVPYLAHNIIKSVTVRIDGQQIDKHYGQWMNIWNELTLTDEKKKSYYEMIGHSPELRPRYHLQEDLHLGINARRLYIPLDFWFCTNSGLALPLIALQYSSVYIDFEFNPLNTLFTVGSPAVSTEELFSDCTVADGNLLLKEKLESQGFGHHNLFQKYARRWNQNIYLDANYIFLDTDERRFFAQTTHEYLIPQLQRNNFDGIVPGTNDTLELEFQHPSKELIWVYRRNDVVRYNDWNNYTRIREAEDWKRIKHESLQHFDSLDHEHDEFLGTIEVSDFVSSLNASLGCDGYTESFDRKTNAMDEMTLLFNGHERFEKRDSTFFTELQVYKYHTGHPNPEGVHVYSFALRPEEHQPSGTANFSRIDKAQFQASVRRTTATANLEYELFIYNRSYNVLRIMAGMGNVVFAN